MSRYSEGLPMIGHHRTDEEYEHEMELMRSITPEMCISHDIILETKESISDENISHAIKQARELGFKDVNDYISTACSYLDSSYE